MAVSDPLVRRPECAAIGLRAIMYGSRTRQSLAVNDWARPSRKLLMIKPEAIDLLVRLGWQRGPERDHHSSRLPKLQLRCDTCEEGVDLRALLGY